MKRDGAACAGRSISIMLPRILAASLSLLIITGLGALSATSCNSWWGDETCLTVHPDVDFAAIDSSSFRGATPDGGGAFQPISSLDNTIDVVRNGWLNLSWTLEVEAVSASNIDLSRLYWRRSDTGGDYLPFSALGNWTQVATEKNVMGTTSIPIDYEYLPSTADSPGDYAVTLTYRVTAAWGSYPLYTVSQDVNLYLHVKNWIVLALHDAIDFGTSDGTGYVLGSGLPPRDVLDKGVFIVSNSPTGWDLSLQVGDIVSPPCYRGDLLSVLFWEIDGSVFHTAVGLAAQPVIVSSYDAPGEVEHRMGYRYTPTTAECGGDYLVTLIYTASPR